VLNPYFPALRWKLGVCATTISPKFQQADTFNIGQAKEMGMELDWDPVLQ